MVGKGYKFQYTKGKKAENKFEKDFYELPNNVFCGKCLENVKKSVRLDFIKKHDFQKILKQQSKLTFNGIHKSSENCNS